MATLEQEKDELERLEILLDDFSKSEPEDLSRKDVLGINLSFEAGIPYFKRTIDLYKELNSYSLESIPYNVLKSIADDADSTHQEFRKIIEFSLDKYPENTIRQRDQIITNIRDRYDNSYKLITPTITYLATKKTDLGDIKISAAKNAEEIENLKSESERTLRIIKKDSDSVLESIRGAAAEKGVSQHAIYFKEESDSHDNTAFWWLLSTIAVGLVTLLYALYNAYYYPITISQLDTSQSIQVAVSKLVIFSILYFGLVWCGRNYRAHRHNAVVNKHRQNALSTFQAFASAAEEDKATKNAVLLRSTEAIFSPHNSGYLSKESEKQNSPQILEIIRNAIDKSD